MDLSLSEAEQTLKESAARFVEREAGRETLVNLSESGEIWSPSWLAAMAAAGWLGLFVPAELGGSGATALEAAVVFEELGRGPVPGPILASSAVSAPILAHLPASALRDTLLRGIADGTAVVIPALRDPEAAWDGVGDSTVQQSAAGTLTCTKLFVPYADAATHFLVSVAGPASGGPSFCVVAAGRPEVSVRKLSGFIGSSFEVVFTDAAVADGQVLTGPSQDALDRALAPGLIAVGAYQAGGSAAVLDMSISYSNTREQFGQPIGRFQRVQDHIIRILNAADTAKWTAYEAAWAIDNGRPEAAARAHLTAAVASEAYLEAANAAHEVHAGIGSDPHLGLTLYTQASRSLYEYLGPPDWHRLRMADGLDWALS
jgi:alkylation response protein AidB-like acyl-CoA dehydrogenase